METNKKFTCDICKYVSQKYWSYERHIESSKHIKNEKNNQDELKMMDNLNDVYLKQIIEQKDKRIENNDKKIEDNHIKIIEEKEKRIEEKEKRIEEKDKRIEEKDKIIEEERKKSEEDRKRIQELERQLETYHSMFSINPKPSMSITQYVIKNYNNAPHLTIFANYDTEKKELVQKESERHESDKKIPINKYVYAEQLISYYLNDKLVQIISNTIINEYKKADPSKQAVWTSDTSRLTYLIKQLFRDDKSNWVIDKKGVETCKYIVDPLLKFVRDDLVEYSIRPLKHTSKMSAIEMELQSKYIQNSQKIISLIDGGILKNSILKEITPAFYMSHNKMITSNGSELKSIEPLGSTGHTGIKLTEVKPTGIKPTEVKPTEVKPTEIKPTEVKFKVTKASNPPTKIYQSLKTPLQIKNNP